MHWRIKNHELALEDAIKARSLNPDLFESHYLIGVILGRKTDPEDQEMIDRALEASYFCKSNQQHESGCMAAHFRFMAKKG